MREKINRYKNIIAGLLLGILLFFVYGYKLHLPAQPYYDETQYIRFTWELIYNNNYSEFYNVHPPLWYLVVMSCIKLFGDYAWVWRMTSLIAGAGVVFLIYKIAKKITDDRAVAGLAAFFSVFDCISLTQARIAMMNSFLLFFMLACLWYLLKAFPDGKPLNKTALRLSGIFFGIALATKLLALNLFLFIAVIIVREALKSRTERSVLLKEAGIFLFVLPLAMHFAVHLVAVFYKDRTLVDVWKIWIFHIKYLVGLRETHAYASKFWSWPFMLRPIWFYFKADCWNTPAGTVSGILCIGNPAIFWLIPVIMGNLLWEFFRKKSSVSGLVLLGFLTQWLFPFALMKLTFFHYFYTAMPFVAMGLSLLMMRIWQAGKFGRGIVIAYLILVAAMFVYWYPLLTGLSIPQNYYQQHMWFKSWI